MDTISYAIDTALNHPENSAVAIGALLVLIVIGLLTGLVQKFFGYIFNLLFKRNNIESSAPVISARDIVNGNYNHIDNSINNNFTQLNIPKIKEIAIKLNGHYRHPNPANSPYMQLRTREESTITRFVFLDNEGNPIGRSTPFYRIMNSDLDLVSNYYLENIVQIELFIKTLYLQNGILYANVETSEGDKWLFTYKAVQGNWKQTYETNHPNLEDQFLLLKKENLHS